MNCTRLLVLTMALVLCASPVTLAGIGSHYEFAMTYDGTSITLDGGSTDPVGVNLFPGDFFTVDLHTAADAYWRVDGSYNQFVPLSFLVNPPGERIGNAVASFRRNGGEVHNISEFGVSQVQVHIGAQEWTLPLGLEFDTVLLDYDLLSASPLPLVAETAVEELPGTSVLNTVIQDSPPYIFGHFGSEELPFFRHPDIAYVPEPATLCLAGLGLLGLAAVRRR